MKYWHQEPNMLLGGGYTFHVQFFFVWWSYVMKFKYVAITAPLPTIFERKKANKIVFSCIHSQVTCIPLLFSEDHKDWLNGRKTGNGYWNQIEHSHLIIIILSSYNIKLHSIFIKDLSTFHHHRSPHNHQSSFTYWLESLLVQNVVAKCLAWIHYWNDKSFNLKHNIWSIFNLWMTCTTEGQSMVVNGRRCCVLICVLEFGFDWKRLYTWKERVCMNGLLFKIWHVYVSQRLNKLLYLISPVLKLFIQCPYFNKLDILISRALQELSNGGFQSETGHYKGRYSHKWHCFHQKESPIFNPKPPLASSRRALSLPAIL